MYPWIKQLTRSAIGLAICAILCANVTHAADQITGRGGTVDALEAYLMNLGLKQLAATQIEQRLAGEIDPKPRQALGQRLSALLLEMMLSQQADSNPATNTRQRFENLIANVPGLESPEVSVMLLQSRYQDAETSVEAWLLGETDPAKHETIRADLAKQFSEISIQLNSRVDQLGGRLLAMEQRATIIQNPREMIAHEEITDLMASVVRRARYFAGWSNYYLGQLTQNPIAMQKGADDFRRLLSVGPDGALPTISYDDFYKTRMALGLAMCIAGSTQPNDIQTGLSYIDTLRLAARNQPNSIAQELDLWAYRLLINANDIPAALNYAATRLADKNITVERGRVAMCVSMVHAGAGATLGNGSQQAALVSQGIQGLLKMGRVELLKSLMDRYGLEVGNGSSFVMQWLNAQQQYTDARNTQTGYAPVAKALEKALKGDDVERYPQAADRCRYLLAWCHYLQGDIPKAARMFRSLSESILPHDPKTAGDSAWMAVEGFRSLAQKDQAYVVLGLDALDWYQRSFPQHEQAQRANYIRGKFRVLESDSIDALALFETVNSDAPDFLAARYDIIQTHYQQWARVQSETGQRPLAAAQLLITAVDRLLQTPQLSASPTIAASALAHAVEVGLWLNEKGQQVPNLAQYADSLDQLVDNSNFNTALAAETRFQLLQWAQAQNDLDTVRNLASWLWEHAPDTGFGLKGLVVFSSILENTITQGQETSADRNKRLRELVTTYERMLTITGASPLVLTRDQTARVASYRLAGSLYFLERYAASAAIFKKLLNIFDNDARYLKMGAMAHYHANLHTEALDYWRRLLPGLPEQTTQWYEAKYYHLSSLIQVDPTRATAVFNQFQLLNPQLGGPDWSIRFQSLAKQLPSTSQGESK